MKKLVFFLVLILVFGSCEKDDSLYPVPDLVSGQFVKLEISPEHARIDGNDLVNSYFGATLSTPGNNVDKYELYVAKRNSFGFLTDFVLLKTITTFPYDLKVNAADISSVGLTNLSTGEVLRFSGRSFLGDQICDFNSLSTVVKSLKSMKQGYKFYTDVSLSPLEPLDNQWTW